MGFIDSYKRLEKLCGEVLNDDKRIPAYIDEMKNGTENVDQWSGTVKADTVVRCLRDVSLPIDYYDIIQKYTSFAEFYLTKQFG